MFQLYCTVHSMSHQIEFTRQCSVITYRRAEQELRPTANHPVTRSIFLTVIHCIVTATPDIICVLMTNEISVRKRERERLTSKDDVTRQPSRTGCGNTIIICETVAKKCKSCYFVRDEIGVKKGWTRYKLLAILKSTVKKYQQNSIRYL
jgi:hypothetical protein